MSMFNKKSIFAILLAMLVASSLGVCMLTGCSSSNLTPESSSEDIPSDDSQGTGESHIHISVAVDFDYDEAYDRGYAGEILGGDVTLTEQSTVEETLIALGMNVEEDDGFVTSINGLANGAYGSASGWVYEVNDLEPSVAADEYILKEGDTVSWIYIIND